MRVLGLETSCDETAVALYDGERGLLAHELHSQVAVVERHRRLVAGGLESQHPHAFAIPPGPN